MRFSGTTRGSLTVIFSYIEAPSSPVIGLEEHSLTNRRAYESNADPRTTADEYTILIYEFLVHAIASCVDDDCWAMRGDDFGPDGRVKKRRT